MNLCDYKDILGCPGEGFHKSRLFGLAINDILAVAVISAMLSYYSYNPLIVFMLLFILGELLHFLFCVDTPITIALKSMITNI